MPPSSKPLMVSLIHFTYMTDPTWLPTGYPSVLLCVGSVLSPLDRRFGGSPSNVPEQVFVTSHITHRNVAFELVGCMYTSNAKYPLRVYEYKPSTAEYGYETLPRLWITPV